MNFPKKTKWYCHLKNEFKKEYFLILKDKIDHEIKNGKVIFPEKKDVFSAFKLTDIDKVKVVLIGQDPYHGEGQAHGLLFSVKKGVKIPPSLRNIYKELNTDLGLKIPTHGYLKNWANRGIFLLNTILTVEKDMAASHRKWGWEIFTDEVIKVLNKSAKPIIFVLWGNFAKSKEVLITSKHHHILKANHPSPLAASRGFFGCKHFSKVNKILKKNGQEEIDWSVEE